MGETAAVYLKKIVAAQKKGRPAGIMSVCSAHPFALMAAMGQARRDGSCLCVESTGNQVNQFGGYAGMGPADFAAFVRNLAEEAGLPMDRILLGGDHIGPGPWKGEPAAVAMTRAKDLVRACVRAGYEKIHLDASMPLKGEGPDFFLAVDRAAELCRAAEGAAGDVKPFYVIGTDVPIPGGMGAAEALQAITRPEDVARTLAVTRARFEALGLVDAWERTTAVVVQPGVDFGPETILSYRRERCEGLTAFIRQNEKFVFEAHATDYQTEAELSRMVEDQFAILKVGPGLTFAFREAVTALAHVEEELGRKGIVLSGMRGVIQEAMTEAPGSWKPYFQGDEAHLRYARYFSFSDRVRNYWPNLKIQSAFRRLMSNLQGGVPLPLISQYLPKQYDAVRRGELSPLPAELIFHKLTEVTSRYASACRTGSGFFP